MSPDERRAPLSYWQDRVREIVYLMKHEVIALHNIAGKNEDKKVAAEMRELANELEDHAEDLKSFLDKRKRL